MSDHVYVRARNSDPETSKQAALEFEADQTKAQRSVSTVVSILEAHGELTDFQIRDFWGGWWGVAFSDSLPCKARGWARRAGLVKHVGFDRHQGRRVRKWGLGPDVDFLDAESESKDHKQSIAELEAKLTTAEKDAERYEWLPKTLNHDDGAYNKGWNDCLDYVQVRRDAAKEESDVSNI